VRDAGRNHYEAVKPVRLSRSGSARDLAGRGPVGGTNRRQPAGRFCMEPWCPFCIGQGLPILCDNAVPLQGHHEQKGPLLDQTCEREPIPDAGIGRFPLDGKSALSS
jgi:hypothetical protein